MARQISQWWWLAEKDLRGQWRNRSGWTTALLLGIVVVATFSLAIDLSYAERCQAVGGLLWVAIILAAAPIFEQSFAAEREDGCWEGLLGLPICRSNIFLAKLTVNALWLAAVQCVLIPLFAMFAGVPLLAHPLAMVFVVLLADVGIASLGTILGAVGAAARSHAAVLVLLLAPALLPVLLSASQATRLILSESLAPDWWRSCGLLAAFAATFLVAGIVLFDFVIEEQADEC